MVGRGEGVGHLGDERLGVLVMDEVLYEVLYGGMDVWLEWMLMSMLIVKRKSIHFYLI